MSTFGFWKNYGMREIGLWLVPDIKNSAANNKQVVILPSAFEQLTSHEREHQVFAAAIRVASSLDLTVVLPTFNCHFTDSYKYVLWTDHRPFDSTTPIRERIMHPAKIRCEFFFHYDYGPLILAVNFTESISMTNFSKANINLECGSNKDVAMQSYYRKILNQQPPTDIVIGGDLACIEDLYSLLPPHSPSSNCPISLAIYLCCTPR